MQTFLPYPSAERSARVLDTKRLGKQRVECLQILATLCDMHKSSGASLSGDIDAGRVSTSPYAFRTLTDDVWIWNPNHRRRGWTNHPAVRMWDRYEAALVEYSLQMCAEWVRRGYRDTVAQTISLMADLSIQVMAAGLTHDGVDPAEIITPVWWGRDDLHRSHQSNLLRKDPVHYGQYFEVPEGLDYVWPA